MSLDDQIKQWLTDNFERITDEQYAAIHRAMEIVSEVEGQEVDKKQMMKGEG